MKQKLSAFLALTLAASSLTAFPAYAALPPLVDTSFESGLDGFTARGNATKVELSTATHNTGSQCAAVTGRTADWNGIAYTLDSAKFSAGTTYNFSVYVMFNTSPVPVNFKLTMEYGGGMGGATYDTFAQETVISGTWTNILAACELKSGTNPVFYIETDSSDTDFYIDDVKIYDPSGDVPEPKVLEGDVNEDGNVNTADAKELRDYLLGKGNNLNTKNADMDQNGKLNGVDLTLLKQRLIKPPVVTTTTTTTMTTTTTTTNNDNPGSHLAPKEYMEKVRSTMTSNVPSNVQSGDSGKRDNIQYYSKIANRQKKAIVWLPPGYDSSKKYPVMYMNHGIFGDQTSMLGGFAVPEMASNLIKSGDAVPFIIVFTQMYSGSDMEQPSFMSGINMQLMDNYDKFLQDMTDSLMPYIEEHYSVKTGRDNTAIAGFSMGGRETLYLTISRPDLFGYAAASSPAPGIVPASDNFLKNHEGSFIPGTSNRMKNGDFKIADDKLPYLLMIAGGTNDTTVGTFPKQYHELFAQNGTDHIWTEVPGGNHDGSVGIPLFYNFFRNVFKA